MRSELSTFSKLDEATALEAAALGWGPHEIDTLLTYTNELRGCHGAGPLSWDERLADSCLAIIKDQCPALKDCGLLSHPDGAAGTGAKADSYDNPASAGGPAGECIAYGSGDCVDDKPCVGQSPQEAVYSWYSEFAQYCQGSIKAPTDTAAGSSSGGEAGCNTASAGHFTAMIWKATTTMGCARSHDRQSTICRFGGPAGFTPPNMDDGHGSYAANVGAVTSTCVVPAMPTYDDDS